MTEVTTLEHIALGDLSAAQARTAIAQALADATGAQRAYAALRAWTWKALNGRRRDPELREWFELLKRTSAYLSDSQPAIAERVTALCDLVYESISVSESFTVDQALSRKYVRDLLSLLDGAPNRRLPRDEIGRRLDLKQANLTRVLNLVAAAGLIERAAYGKEAIFQLTPQGAEAAGPLSPATIQAPPLPALHKNEPEPQNQVRRSHRQGKRAYA